jgi:hypothetical protein
VNIPKNKNGTKRIYICIKNVKKKHTHKKNYIKKLTKNASGSQKRIEEVDKLRSILLTKYQLESSSVAQGSGKEQYVLYIPKREVPKLQALVKSHMPASMLYRIGF